MGIDGLFQHLKTITEDKVHISRYKGQRMGIDAYVWLHQKLTGLGTEICLGKPKGMRDYVSRFMNEIKLLLHEGVIPVVVFDGGYLPGKARVEEERRLKRAKALEEGKRLYRAGDQHGAHKCFTSAVDVTPVISLYSSLSFCHNIIHFFSKLQMAFEIIRGLKQLNVEYMVAPYEADAQLAYLFITNYVKVVMSIDSDLLVFGCTRLYTKYKKGVGQEVNLQKLKGCFHPFNFSKFSPEMFVQFCIFIGCDYLKRIKGCGPAKIYPLMSRHKQWRSVIQAIKRMGRKYKVPKDYELNYQRVE